MWQERILPVLCSSWQMTGLDVQLSKGKAPNESDPEAAATVNLSGIQHDESSSISRLLSPRWALPDAFSATGRASSAKPLF